MSDNKISRDDAALLLNKLLTESTPVVALCKSGDGPSVVLPGFVDSITFENGLVISSVKGKPATSSHVTVPLPGTPLGSACTFMFGDRRHEKNLRANTVTQPWLFSCHQARGSICCLPLSLTRCKEVCRSAMTSARTVAQPSCGRAALSTKSWHMPVEAKDLSDAGERGHRV